MFLIIVEFSLVIFGLIISWILYNKFPFVHSTNNAKKYPKITIVIPARNEEKNLPLILGDLKKQEIHPFEIICIDDCSIDETAKIAQDFGVKVISIIDKPSEWVGKSWACQRGAEEASTDILMFIDADVRLESDSIGRLLQTYFDNNCTISVQPYHMISKGYEQLSMFFNFIQISSTGITSSSNKYFGLYGPIIMINKDDYLKMGGHSSVKESVIEDVDLGIRMKDSGIPYKLYIGDKDIRFRMYSSGLKDLINGWLKNFATGASKMSTLGFLAVFFWITSCLSVPIHIIFLSFSFKPLLLSIYVFLYFIWVFEIYRIASKIGNFKFSTMIFYPISLFFFLIVFILSFFKKILGLKTSWKGRKV